MTKVAAIAINSKNIKQPSSLEPKTYDLKARTGPGLE